MSVVETNQQHPSSQKSNYHPLRKGGLSDGSGRGLFFVMKNQPKSQMDFVTGIP